MGTHHDVQRGIAQARDDFEILVLHPDGLATLRSACAAVVAGDHPRAGLCRDLCVYEGYHEGLLALVDDVLAHGFPAEIDPDLSFFAMLRFCATLPDTPPRLSSVFREVALESDGDVGARRGAAA